MTTNSREPLKLFYCYAHEDKMLRDQLDAHLSMMKRQKLVEVWYDHEIIAGSEWKYEVDIHLTSAHIILLLVSAWFLNSDYCYGVEMQKVLQRHQAGIVRVVPILLRPVDWENAPFSHLQILPTGVIPVTQYVDYHDAFENIAKELRRVAKDVYVSLKTPEEWREEGIALSSLNRNEEALVAFEQAIRLNPTDARAYYNKGIALDDLKRFEEALVAYNQAIQLEPNLPLASVPQQTLVRIQQASNNMHMPKGLKEATLRKAYTEVKSGNIKDAETIRSLADQFLIVANNPELNKSFTFDAGRAALNLYTEADIRQEEEEAYGNTT